MNNLRHVAHTLTTHGQHGLASEVAEISKLIKSAAVKNFEKTVKEIAELTEGNNHTEAIVLGAELLGATKYVKIAKLINQIIGLEGHSPSDLSKYSHSIYEEVVKLAKQKLSPEEYELFYRAF